ncbi:MAG: hypothetical protein Q9195_008041 [Heterodermia aff. obscurata]
MESATASSIPAWAALETRSAESGPQVIPPELHGKVFSWKEIKKVIEENRLDVIRRRPEDRVVYKAWCKKTIEEHGSITGYMCVKRLQWTPLPESSAETGPLFDACDPMPFADSRDYKILRNDWPYGSFEAGIEHLIVWSKARIPVDKETGLVTPESRQLIEHFVQRTFVSRLEMEGAEADEKVVWFKNWVALQSVPGLEHIHVLVKDVPENIIVEWAGEKFNPLQS